LETDVGIEDFRRKQSKENQQSTLTKVILRRQRDAYVQKVKNLGHKSSRDKESNRE
jgi:hypothetical protein